LQCTGTVFVLLHYTLGSQVGHGRVVTMGAQGDKRKQGAASC
jgi:hypothetical protein